MKAVLMLSLIIAVVMTAGIGSLIIFEVFTFDQGLEYIVKTVAAIALIGISVAAIVHVTRPKNTSDE